MIDFRYREPGVHRNHNHSKPGTSIDQLEIVGFVWQEQDQAVAGSETVLAERRSNTSDTIVKFSKTTSRSARRKRGLLRIIPRSAAQGVRMNHCGCSALARKAPPGFRIPS